MNALNLTFPGLEAVAAASAKGDLDLACESLATYYANANTSSWYRIPSVTPGTGRVGNGSLVDNAVDFDIYYMAGVDATGKIPRNQDGGLDWIYKGPRNDVEFMNCLNRFDVFTWLLSAYQSTGNPVYPRYFDALVSDWVIHNSCPNALGVNGGELCSPQGVTTYSQCNFLSTPQICKTGTFESPWRSLEMGIRTNGVFASAFFGFQKSADFSTSSRVLLVLAMSEHNAALIVDGGHPGTGTPNWELGQWSGLITSSVTFPELKNTSVFRTSALDELEVLYQSFVYPDGVETEMASGYDMWTASEGFGVLKNLAQGGDVLPPQNFSTHNEMMWNYGAYITDPAGCLPRNGDSDLCGSGFGTSGEEAKYFNRADWTWLASHGNQGTPPNMTNGPSSIFPWAGQVALRSSFDVNATFAFFDVGPYGSSGHAHRDKLHFNLHAFGSMLLVDSGRFAYAGTDLSAILHTEYGRFTFAHNTLTIDGADQLPTPAIATSAIPSTSYLLSPEKDWVLNNMSDWDPTVLKGSATHTRSVYYQRKDANFFLIIDKINTDRVRGKVEATWHAHPNSTGVTIDASNFIAIVGGVNTHTGQPTQAQACIIPATGTSVSLWKTATIVQGVMQNATTHYQGWYSQAYDDAWPAPTLIYQAENVADDSIFAWLIVPQNSRASLCSDTAKVLSITKTNVIIQVNVAGVQQSVTVPIA